MIIRTLGAVVFLSYTLGVGTSYSQHVAQAFQQIAKSFADQNYEQTVSLCAEIIDICESGLEPECNYTNLIKEIYRYKGLAEFELYKKELNSGRLSSAIESLNYSYLLFRDPEIRFLQGYWKILAAILNQSNTDLSGVIIAWEALLDLYARDQWQISQDLLVKVKMFIPAVEKFAIPNAKRHYSGSFARFTILLACDLIERGPLSADDQTYFTKIRVKYQEKSRAGKWQFDHRASHSEIPTLKFSR